jgi:RimJ/RimL family protein N-acetyltransferase
MQIHLETARLVLRCFTLDDVANLVALDSDPAVMRYLSGGIPTPRAALATTILPAFLRSYDRFPGFGVFAAHEKASGGFIGWFALRPPAGAGPEHAELGYRLIRRVWGQGLATEGALALIHQGFTALGVQRISATTYQDNMASRRVMEKAGMTFTRAFRFTAADLAAQDTFDTSAVAPQPVWEGDDVEYAITREQWERAAGG